MQTLTRQHMDASKVRRAKYYPLNDDVQVRLQSLTESEKSYFDSYVADENGKFSRARAAQRRRLLIQMTLIGDDGTQLYKESELDTMLSCDAKLTDPIYELAVKHTGVFQEVGEGNGQTGAATTGDSGLPTDSVSNSASTTQSPGLTASPATSSTDGSTTTNASPGATPGDTPAP